MAQQTKDKAITAAKQLAEEDAARAQDRAVRDTDEITAASDDLLDEIDSLLENQEVLAKFRQRGGE